MRSPSPHDANDTDAAAFSGELAAWQQHNAGALFPHPHGELLVAPLNPNLNPNPTCHHQFSTNAPLPHFVPPSLSEFTMDPHMSVPPLCYSAPYSMSPYPPPIFHPGLCLWLPRHPIFTFLTMPLPGLPFLALPPTPTAWGWPIFKPNLLSSLHILYHTPHSLCSLWLSCLRLQIKTIIFQ